jgi:hypothetical protein
MSVEVQWALRARILLYEAESAAFVLDIHVALQIEGQLFRLLTFSPFLPASAKPSRVLVPSVSFPTMTLARGHAPPPDYCRAMAMRKRSSFER